jgi:GntR family transcriptional regulator, transcriptional repressor for pyruvate dehydrogenase complex
MPDNRAKDNPRSQAAFLGQPVRVTKAYEALATIIRERIVSGELAEGDRIPSESTLAREAQVSRSTVREALRTLEEAGLIARASPKIMVVSAGDEGHARKEFEGALRRQNVTFKHLHEALLLLEPELTRLATERATTPDVAELEANLSAQADTLESVSAFNELDQEFHLAIAQMSGNPALVMVRAPVSELLQPLLERFITSAKLAQRSLDFHRRILEEIQIRDADAAALMVRKHVNDLRTIWEEAGLNLEVQITAVGDELVASRT